MQLVSLVRSNLLGFNAPAIAATEGAYESMWAQNVAALTGYNGAASAVAEQLASSQQALKPLSALAGQGVSSAAAAPAGVTPGQLATIFGTIAKDDKNAINNQANMNRNNLAGAQITTQKDLNAIGPALAAGKIGEAATDLIAVQFINIGIPLAVASQTAGLIGELLPADLALLGQLLVP